MRKPIEERINKPEILTIKYDTQRNGDKITFGQSINDFITSCYLFEVGKIKDKAMLSKLTVIELQGLIDLCNEIIGEKTDFKLKNVGETVKIDLGFCNKKGEYVEDIQEVDLEKE